MKFAWLFFLFTCLIPVMSNAQTTTAPRPLEFGIAETTSPPLYFPPEERKGKDSHHIGILNDIYQALAKELHQKANISPAPRGRVAMMLLYGEMDAYCYTRPDWLEHSSELHWSTPLFDDQNVIVTRKETPAVKEVHELTEKTVATVFGFRYPELGEPFASLNLTRSDSPDVGTTMTKLELKRVDYALMDDLFFKYYKKNHPKADLNESIYVIRSFEVFCAVSPKAPFTVKEFNGAIEKLKENHSIQKILEKYQ
jgi:polar amino acid transport system substrate-binding protein